MTAENLPSAADRILGHARALIVAAADPEACDVARDLADLVDALDRLLRHGGRLPADWDQAERRERLAAC